MDIFNDSLRLSLVHGGYDALCVGNVIVQGVDGEFGRSRDFKCDIPPQETIEYDTSAIYDCRPFNPDPARSGHILFAQGYPSQSITLNFGNQQRRIITSLYF